MKAEPLTLRIEIDDSFLEDIFNRLQGDPERIIAQALVERVAQDKQWGGPATDDTRYAWDWNSFVNYQQVRAKEAAFKGQGDEWRERMIKTIALSMAAVESYDRKQRAYNPLAPQGDGPFN